MESILWMLKWHVLSSKDYIKFYPSVLITVMARYFSVDTLVLIPKISDTLFSSSNSCITGTMAPRALVEHWRASLETHQRHHTLGGIQHWEASNTGRHPTLEGIQHWEISNTVHMMGSLALSWWQRRFSFGGGVVQQLGLRWGCSAARS